MSTFFLPYENSWLAFIRLRLIPPSTKARKDKDFSIMNELCSLDGSQTRIGFPKDLISGEGEKEGSSRIGLRLFMKVKAFFESTLKIHLIRFFVASRSIGLHLAFNYQKRNGSAFYYPSHKGLSTSLFRLQMEANPLSNTIIRMTGRSLRRYLVFYVLAMVLGALSYLFPIIMYPPLT